MKSRRQPRGISPAMLRRLSTPARLQLWNFLTSDLLDVPPLHWSESGKLPTRDEAAAALVRAVKAAQRKVYAS